LTVVSLEEEFLHTHTSDITQFDPASITLRPVIGLKDKFLWHLGARLDALVSTPDPPTVFVEQIMATMAMHLVLMSDERPVKLRSRALSRKALRLTSEYVEANLSKDIRLEALAALAGLSIYHFSRQFGREMGMGVGRYVQVRKMQRAAELLAEKTLDISEIGEAVGYRDASSFARAFRSVYGLSPHAYRNASF
jgi:AraC family transcriptional regulator